MSESGLTEHLPFSPSHVNLTQRAERGEQAAASSVPQPPRRIRLGFMVAALLATAHRSGADEVTPTCLPGTYAPTDGSSGNTTKIGIPTGSFLPSLVPSSILHAIRSILGVSPCLALCLCTLDP